MSTQIETGITSAFVDIKASLSLVASTSYIIQNTGTGDLIVAESAIAPADLKGHIVKPNEYLAVTIGADKMFVRSSSDDGEATVTED